MSSWPQVSLQLDREQGDFHCGIPWRFWLVWGTLSDRDSFFLWLNMSYSSSESSLLLLLMEMFIVIGHLLWQFVHYHSSYQTCYSIWRWFFSFSFQHGLGPILTGILSLSWCKQDTNMLFKDNRVLLCSIGTSKCLRSSADSRPHQTWCSKLNDLLIILRVPLSISAKSLPNKSSLC